MCIRDRVDRATVIEVLSDRCDAEAKHPAQAFVFAQMPDGRSLSFCGHHGAEFMDGLIAAGAIIIDQRHLIGS